MCVYVCPCVCLLHWQCTAFTETHCILGRQHNLSCLVPQEKCSVVLQRSADSCCSSDEPVVQFKDPSRRAKLGGRDTDGN